MAGLDREQLDALRRQVEEDYRLDIAAIDRLQRRLAVPAPASSSARNGTVPESRGPVLSKMEPSSETQSEPQPDELTGTLRTMFSNYRK